MAQGRCSAMLSVVLLLVSAAALAQGATFKVGGNGTWAVPTANALPTTFYSDWAKNQTFAVGDVVTFTYSAAGHDVVSVTSANYDSCSSASPIKEYATGNDSIPLVAGLNYFICGKPGHCTGGQKVVMNATAAAGSTPTPPPPPSSTPPSGAAENTVAFVQVLVAATVAVVASLALW